MPWGGLIGEKQTQLDAWLTKGKMRGALSQSNSRRSKPALA